MISVYITNYNYGNYIKQSIESVLNQTFQDFELLIIDDGSTDNSKEIIERYCDNPKVSIIYQKNKGLNITNNIAMRVAKGKFIIRLDADDFFAENALELMATKLENDNELGLVFPDYFYIDATGLIIGEEKRHNFEKDVTLFDQPAHGACTMIRLCFLRELGGYNESYTCQDGYELWVKFIMRYKVANINHPLFYYRRHGKNLTSNEENILSTRAKIKQFYTTNRFGIIPSFAILPIRAESLAFIKIGSKNLLDVKIQQLLKSIHIKKIVISSPETSIKNYILDNYSEESKIIFHLRNMDKARININLDSTIEEIFETYCAQNYKTLAVVSIEFPFIKSETFDDAINTLFLFNSDSLISVREDESLIYSHNGNGMMPVLNRDKYTKLEREALYRWTGGIACVKWEVYKQKKQITTGKIGHIVIDQESSLGVFSDFDLKMIKLIADNKNIENNATN